MKLAQTQQIANQLVIRDVIALQGSPYTVIVFVDGFGFVRALDLRGNN